MIEGIRGAGNTKALHAATDERRNALNSRAFAMLDTASMLHRHLEVLNTSEGEHV